MFFALLSFLCPAEAAIPLVVAIDIADHGLKFWWREGEFLAGSKETGLGIKPLGNAYAPPASIPLPQDISEWTELGSECVDTMSLDHMIDGVQHKITVVPVSGKANVHAVRLYREDLLLADNVIPRPVELCSLHLLQTDQLLGEEIVIIWGIGETLRGATVFHIPETAK
jgi:hypothetical protein